MYIKLAIQNMKKSIRNYVIYFVTITLTAAMMYSFLALGFSKEVLTMSENISMLTSGILGMSVLVALIASFVISYAIRLSLIHIYLQETLILKPVRMFWDCFREPVESSIRR